MKDTNKEECENCKSGLICFKCKTICYPLCHYPQDIIKEFREFMGKPYSIATERSQSQLELFLLKAIQEARESEKNKVFAEHLRDLEESKKMSYEQGHKRGYEEGLKAQF